MQISEDLYLTDGVLNRKRITVLSKRQSIQLLRTHCLFWHVNSLKKTIYTLRKIHFFRTVDLILIVKSDLIIIVMNTVKKLSFYLRRFSESRSSSGSTPSVRSSVRPSVRPSVRNTLGYQVCVICNSKTFHSFLFKICLMIIHILKMCTSYFVHVS